VIARCARGRPGVQDHNGCWIRSSKYAPAQLIVSLLANLLGRSASTIFYLLGNYAIFDFGVCSGWNHFPAEKLSLVLIGPVLHDCGRVHIADSGQGLQFGFAGAIYTTSGDASGADAFCAVLAVGGVLLPSEVWAGTEPVSAKRLRRIATRRANFMTTIISSPARAAEGDWRNQAGLYSSLNHQARLLFHWAGRRVTREQHAQNQFSVSSFLEEPGGDAGEGLWRLSVKLGATYIAVGLAVKSRILTVVVLLENGSTQITWGNNALA
jgi:hypothetical protein